MWCSSPQASTSHTLRDRRHQHLHFDIAFVHKHIAVTSPQLFSHAELCWQLSIKYAGSYSATKPPLSFRQGLAVTTVAKDKVANVLLASKGRGAAGGPAHTAQDLSRSIARELLGPLLDTACCRLASLLRHAFDIAADSQQLLQGECLTRLMACSSAFSSVICCNCR